jgi:hypothetical protein
MRGSGLDAGGFIERDGSASKVAEVFAPVVAVSRF